MYLQIIIVLHISFQIDQICTCKRNFVLNDDHIFVTYCILFCRSLLVVQCRKIQKQVGRATCTQRGFFCHQITYPAIQNNKLDTKIVMTLYFSACQAATDTDLQGVCYTSQECSDNGGTTDGNCAASFGVCCILK